MSMNLITFRVLIYFTGYDYVHFASHYLAKMGPTGITWGLMHIPVMMHYPVMYGTVQYLCRCRYCCCTRSLHAQS